MENQMKKRNGRKIVLGILGILIFLVLLFVGYEIATQNKQYYRSEKNLLLPIFIYHDVGAIEGREEFMQTSEEKFEEQISGLLKKGYHFITYEDLIAYEKGEKALYKKSAMIAFDDGYEGNYTRVYPIIKKYQVPISISIVDDRVGVEEYMTWDQIRELDQSGLVSIYTHGKHHDQFDKIDVDTAVADVEEAHQHIEQELGKDITKVFTYPYGLYSREMVEALSQKGFVQNLTDSKINTSKKLDLSELHRMYPLEMSPWEIELKVLYRSIRY